MSLGLGIVNDKTLLTSMAKTTDADGRGWLWVTYTNDGVKNTPMKIKPSTTGWCATDLADDTNYFYVGVPHDTFATNAIGRIQVEGPVISMITASLTATAGTGLNITNGAVANPNAYTTTAWTGEAAQREFACVRVSKAVASTRVNCWLLGERIKGS